MNYELYIIRHQNSLPRDISKYQDWIRQEIQSTDPKRRDDSSILLGSLRKFYSDLLKSYPALTGRDKTEDCSKYLSVYYCLTPNLIRMSFCWSETNRIQPRVMELVRKYGLILYRVDRFALFGDSVPIKIVYRHQVDDYPSVWKAILHSLRDPAFLFILTIGTYLLLSKIPMPDYMLSFGNISIWIIVVIAAIICTYLGVIEVRTQRNGICSSIEDDRGISGLEDLLYKEMTAKVLTINFDGLDKIGLLQLMKDEFGFFDGFGMNWDALIDCLSYLRDPKANLSKVFFDEDEFLIITCKNLLKADFDTNHFLDVVQCVNDREMLSCGKPLILLNLIPSK